MLLATLTAYVLFEYYRPKPLDWTPTYENDDKIPFGTQALYELLPGMVQQPTVRSVRIPIYNFLTETKLPPRSNYVFVTRAFSADQNDLKHLMRYVRRGNSVLISAYDMSDSLGAVLGFKAEVKDPTRADSTLRQNFVNLQLAKVGGYNFFHDDGRNFLRINQAQNMTVLGRNARHEPVFIKIRYGSGQFLVHNLPLAFTNYYVLDPKTSDYVGKVLAYLPAGPTYWDEYQKKGRFDADEQSLFRYIWHQPALTWAYYITVFGLIFLALFAGKRTQRIIPVVELPRNTSVDFVKTVGRLYFQQGDHDNLARQKMQYFLAHLRDQYGLNTNNLDKEFVELLASKSGISRVESGDLVRLLRNGQKSISMSEYDLLTLNREIDRFHEVANAR